MPGRHDASLPKLTEQYVACEDVGCRGGLVARQLRWLAAAPGGGRKKWLMDDRFEVAVGAGTLMSDSAAAACFPRVAPVGHLGARPVHPVAVDELGLLRAVAEGADGCRRADPRRVVPAR